MSAGVMKRQSLATVIVDTTVQPKAIAHPTDSRPLNPSREQLVTVGRLDSSMRRVCGLRPAIRRGCCRPRA